MAVPRIGSTTTKSATTDDDESEDDVQENLSEENEGDHVLQVHDDLEKQDEESTSTSPSSPPTSDIDVEIARLSSPLAILSTSKLLELGAAVESTDDVAVNDEGDDSKEKNQDQEETTGSSVPSTVIADTTERSLLSSTVCNICLDSFQVGDLVAHASASSSSCPHVFHEECIVAWFASRYDYIHFGCPCCRQEILLAEDSDSLKDLLEGVVEDALTDTIEFIRYMYRILGENTVSRQRS